MGTVHDALSKQDFDMHFDESTSHEGNNAAVAPSFLSSYTLSRRH